MTIAPNHRFASSEPKPARLGASMTALAAAALKKPRPTVTGMGRTVAELARVVRGTIWRWRKKRVGWPASWSCRRATKRARR